MNAWTTSGHKFQRICRSSEMSRSTATSSVDVDVLARHFSKEQTIEGAGQAAQPGLVDYDMAVSEWILLRSLMSTAHRGMNCEQFVSSLFAKHANVFPALCVVASAAAALPVTNASPERGFSTPIQLQTGF